MALTAVICLPGIATVVLMSRAMRPDLFDLVPKVIRSDGYMILHWPDLERRHHTLYAGQVTTGATIRALGYMMDGDRPIRDGDSVQGFILLPDVGNPGHPDHRFGDQMIEVRLETGEAVRFAERSLVWAWGTLRTLKGNPNGHEPLYVLDHARTEPASKADIQKYFK
jgi:hypothetical protein